MWIPEIKPSPSGLAANAFTRRAVLPGQHSFKLRITSKMSVYTFMPQSAMGKQSLVRGGHWGNTDMTHPNALLPGFCLFHGAPALSIWVIVTVTVVQFAV